MLDAMRVYKEIRADVKDELDDQPDDAPDPTRATLETMKLAKELFAQPAAPPAATKDPLEIAVSLATTMMQMKADNPVVDILRDELKSLREELREARKPPAVPAVQPKSFLDQLFELVSDDSKLDKVKKVVGLFGGGGEVSTRAPRMGGFELVREIVSSPFGANLGQGLGTLLTQLATPATQPNGTPAARPVSPTPINGQPAESDQQRIQRIAATITNPMINEFFDPGEPGDVFAERVFDLWPDDYRFIRGIGADSIINLYRQHNAQLWAHVAQREQQFRQFVKEFCEWQIPDDEEPSAPTKATADVDGFEPAEESAL